MSALICGSGFLSLFLYDDAQLLLNPIETKQNTIRVGPNF